ncbi:hypothetical protein BD413DRAFT_51856 [Trametes elegans]|nr:hypothetical protein BD413DRAFT_51856 [Trametes elegans]
MHAGREQPDARRPTPEALFSLLAVPARTDAPTSPTSADPSSLSRSHPHPPRALSSPATLVQARSPSTPLPPRPFRPPSSSHGHRRLHRPSYVSPLALVGNRATNPHVLSTVMSRSSSPPPAPIITFVSPIDPSVNGLPNRLCRVPHTPGSVRCIFPLFPRAPLRSTVNHSWKFAFRMHFHSGRPQFSFAPPLPRATRRQISTAVNRSSSSSAHHSASFRIRQSLSMPRQSLRPLTHQPPTPPVIPCINRPSVG